MKRQYEIQGFTLIEVLVVMAVVGILSAIAAPSFLSFANSQKLNAAQSELINSIKAAQSKAKKEKVKVKLVVGDSFIKSASKEMSFEDVKLSSPLGSNVEIEFNAQGLPNKVNGNSFQAVDFQVNLPNSQAKRCVSIATLLGALITKDKACG